MSWAAVAVGVGSMIMNQQAAGDAVSAQQRAARQGIDAQNAMFDKQVALQEPFRQTGLAANNRLAYLLGLTTDSGTGGSNALSYDSLRQQLAPQFTSRQTVTNQIPLGDYEADPHGNIMRNVTSEKDVLNQGGLDAEILRRMQADEATRMATAQGDQQFGSLMRDFSMQDFECPESAGQHHQRRA